MCKPVRDSGQLSFSLVKSALRCVLDRLCYDHKAFHIDRHDILHLSNAVNSMLHDGILTKDSWRTKHWVTAAVIKRLATALFEDILEPGTLSWDKVITKAVSIVLLSALVCRAGDISVSQYYEDYACLRYEHIKIKLEVVDGTGVLLGSVILYYCKEKK